MYNSNDSEFAGIPYNDIVWYDITGQPFGTAAYFNAIILGNANNIVDTKGAMAIGGNFNSPRSLTLGFGNDAKLTGTGYNPELVRFLVGKDVAMQSPLVVAGHVVVGGNFRAGKGSTYMIGKDGSSDQAQELTALYEARGGSRYWRLSDRDTHYAVSSYDVPRYIPASRVNADVAGFFEDAENSLMNFHDCIVDLQPNGTVTEHYHEWILRGNNPVQNVFLIDVSPIGNLNKEIRFEIPSGSLAIVKLRTGNNAHLQYGLWGEKALADRTLYVFEDATNIYMEVPAAIWGSIFAPQANFNAHQTGGTVYGNAALGSFAVNANSGFEFHIAPFIGGVECRAITPAPIPAPMPAPAPAPIPRPAPIPAPAPIPRPAPIPAPAPIPRPAPIPAPAPIPRPAPIPAPAPIPRPAPIPAPAPIPRPAPMPAPIPIPRPIPVPIPVPAPCPICPEQAPCPICPEQTTRTLITPIPIPIPIPCPEEEECKEECLIKPGIIFGCIWGCCCCCDHEWEVKLYRTCGDRRVLLYCNRMNSCGCFEFEVPYDDFYVLEICPVGYGKSKVSCKAVLTLKNVGVANLSIE